MQVHDIYLKGIKWQEKAFFGSVVLDAESTMVLVSYLGEKFIRREKPETIQLSQSKRGIHPGR